jgi:hypothetical protein
MLGGDVSLGAWLCELWSRLCEAADLLYEALLVMCSFKLCKTVHRLFEIMSGSAKQCSVCELWRWLRESMS